MTSPNSLEEARELVLRLLAGKDRTCSQVYEALAARGLGGEQALLVIEGFKASGLLDDKAYAVNLVERLLERKQCGPRYLLAALLRAGIDNSLAEAVVNMQVNQEREKELALLSLKSELNKGQSDPLRLFRILSTRGFAREACLACLEEEFGCCLDIIP